MSFDPFDLLAACRRSRTKLRAYRALVERAPLLPAELAAIVGTTIARADAVLHGDGDSFRHDTSLVALGVAVALETPQGVAYTLTPRGRAVASFIAERTAGRG